MSPKRAEPGAGRRHDRWRGPALDAAAVLAGLLFPLGFAPFGWYGFGLLGLTALFAVAVVEGTTPRRAAWRGWLFGLGANGLGVSWVQESFQYSNLTGPLSLLLAAGFVAFLSLYPALATYLAARIPAPSPRWRLAALMPGAWCLLEWLRGEALSGFTWLQVGYAFVDSPIAGLFPLAGVYGTGLAVSLIAGALAAVCAGGWRRAPVLAWLAVLVAAFAASLALHGRAWTRPAGPPLEVALLQGNVAQAEKWKPHMREPTLALYLQMTRRNLDADLVVWPETAMPGFYHTLTGFLGQLAAETGRHGTVVLAGVPVADAATRTFLNSVVLVGSRPVLYSKRHLVPFGEYLPLRPVLQPITDALGIPIANFSPGPWDQPLLEVRGQRLGIFICYEISFGSDVRSALPEANLLVTVSNDAWFGRSIGPHQHLQIARARALESGRWLLRATNTGLTALVDPFGVVREQAPQFEVAEVRGRATPMAGATPYTTMGDWPALAAAALLLVVSPVAGRGAAAARAAGG